MNPITAVEIIKAANGKTRELRKALQDLVPICQKGPGCLQYQLLEPAHGSGEFLILMQWRSLEDLARHEASELIQDFVRRYDGILYGEVTQTEWIPVH
jgi:quinol monooxygenase YgiN